MNKDNELTFFLCGTVIATIILVILIITYSPSETQDDIVESTSVIFETEETIEEATEEETTIEETTTEEATMEAETIVIDIPTTEESTTEEETTTEEPTTEIVTEPATEAPTEPETPAPSPYVMNFSPEDADLLVRVAYAETRSSGPEGMALVMNVILNRCRLHNASIHDIVYSPQQFQVLDIMYQLTPSQDAYTALEMVKLGWDGSQGALYFCSPAHNKWHAAKLQYLFTYMGTEYYK